MPNDHRPRCGLLPGMSATSDGVRRGGGRRGRRTAGMVRIARERISSLFVLAEIEATHSHSELADRYVSLARRIGTRYNVRLLPEYKELYCRGCSSFWVEGRTVRTRLRTGRRVRTCLKCGRKRRTIVRQRRRIPGPEPEVPGPGAARTAVAFVDDDGEDELGPLPDDEPEGE